jgi:oligopeptide transport system ATP-binding protein
MSLSSEAATTATDTILEIADLKVHFPVRRGFLIQRSVGTVKAVDGVSLALGRGEVLGLVGESGCGKSTLARAIVQLVRATSGTIRLDGRDLTALRGRDLRAMRTQVQMVFQDPYASLNPRMTVADTLAEPLLVHGRATRADVSTQVAELMERVGLAPRLMRKYPHEFSGGQRQRIAIARALALRPRLIIADEPVSALDVSIQAQILNLLAALVREMGLSMIFIAHDLSVVKHISDRIAVMYLGKIVELGAAADVIERPQHPYTRALISAIPTPDPAHERTRQRIVLAGDPPSPIDPPAGCAFHPRCRHAVNACRLAVPVLEKQPGARHVACMRVDEIDI